MSTEARNLNYMTGTRSTLVLGDKRDIQFTALDWSIPGVSLNAAIQATPHRDLRVPGDKMQWDPLVIKFIVNEDLTNWLEAFNWLVSIGAPQDYSQYEGLGFQDATVTIYDSHNNVSRRVKFTDCIPVSLSQIDFSSQEAETDYKYCTLVLEYSHYSFE